ncbi:MAG TPA: SLBB domain-containing protein [Steroidobacteraceae bacterium]
MLLLACAWPAMLVWGAQQPAPPPAPLPVPAAPGLPAANPIGPLTPIGPGDSVTLHVFGQPDMDSVLGIADDGTIRVPLAGAVQVAGLSPDAAARRVESAFKNGGFFVDPHVTLTVTQSLSQRVSVLGEVKTPGRYPIDAKTSIIDLLAQAGGETEFASDTVYVLRPDASGAVKRFPVNLKRLVGPGASAPAPAQALRAGDSVFVPRAEQFFILGEVQKPGMYKLEPDLTVLQAISLAGGVTAKGSDRRFEIKRAGKNGEQEVVKPKPNDLVQPDDVIRVKESIF